MVGPTEFITETEREDCAENPGKTYSASGDRKEPERFEEGKSPSTFSFRQISTWPFKSTRTWQVLADLSSMLPHLDRASQ